MNNVVPVLDVPGGMYPILSAMETIAEHADVTMTLSFLPEDSKASVEGRFPMVCRMVCPLDRSEDGVETAHLIGVERLHALTNDPEPLAATTITIQMVKGSTWFSQQAISPMFTMASAMSDDLLNPGKKEWALSLLLDRPGFVGLRMIRLQKGMPEEHLGEPIYVPGEMLTQLTDLAMVDLYAIPGVPGIGGRSHTPAYAVTKLTGKCCLGVLLKDTGNSNELMQACARLKYNPCESARDYMLAHDRFLDLEPNDVIPDEVVPSTPIPTQHPKPAQTVMPPPVVAPAPQPTTRRRKSTTVAVPASPPAPQIPRATQENLPESAPTPGPTTVETPKPAEPPETKQMTTATETNQASASTPPAPVQISALTPPPTPPPPPTPEPAPRKRMGRPPKESISTLLDKLSARASESSQMSFEVLVQTMVSIIDLQKALLAALPTKRGVDRSKLADEIAAIIRGTMSPVVEPPADDDSNDDTPEA